PWPAISGCCPHAITEGLRGMSFLREHGFESLLNVPGAAVGQSGNNGPAGKKFGVCREHNRSHGAAGREAGHEYFASVGTTRPNGVVDHLLNRKRLAVPARDVARQKPRKATLGIVDVLLLRINNCETEADGMR